MVNLITDKYVPRYATVDVLRFEIDGSNVKAVKDEILKHINEPLLAEDISNETGALTLVFSKAGVENPFTGDCGPERNRYVVVNLGDFLVSSGNDIAIWSSMAFRKEFIKIG